MAVFVETYMCKLCLILRSRVLGGGGGGGSSFILMKDVGRWPPLVLATVASAGVYVI